MNLSVSIQRVSAYLIAIMAFSSVQSTRAAMDPRFELDPRTLNESNANKKTSSKADKRRNHPTRSHPSQLRSEGTVHVLKPGDNLHRILVRSYGFNDDEADTLIEKICQLNNIRDIRRLKIGQRITIPPLQNRSDKVFGVSPSQRDVIDASHRSGSITARQTFVLPTPSKTQLNEQENLLQLKDVWNKLVPAKSERQKPFTVNSSTFSLTLDPKRYPMYPTMDGNLILVDPKNSIPPLVKALIQEKEPSVKIISELPSNSRQLWSAMLKSAGFYSIEEDFSIIFGTDPKLTVYADFKIEKTPDSLLQQDLVLLNNGRQALSPTLKNILKKDGFTVYETVETPKTFSSHAPREVRQITATHQPEIVDDILDALSVSPERNIRLNVFTADDNGVSLSILADRTFVRDGQKFVISLFDGDPVSYTLFRILKNRGYHVIILDKKDGFIKAAEKILSEMNLYADFGQHDLINEENIPFSLQMTGFLLENVPQPGGCLFLSNVELDQTIRTLLSENGYTIQTR